MIRTVMMITTLSTCILFHTEVASSAVNVAHGKPVILNGVYGLLRPGSGWDGSLPVASGATLVDGVFEPAGQLWNRDSVWWDAVDPASTDNSIEIDLLSVLPIEGFIVQADDNDAYRIEYLDAANNWVTAYDVPIVGGWGLQTRPNPSDNTEVFVLPSPVSTNRLRFTATAGDGYFSVSEIQAFSSVPEPTSIAAWSLLGLTLAGARLRRRRRTA